MPEKLNSLDHIVLLVDNLELASSQFRALGFTVTPKALHTDIMGTANSMVMFDDHYIELLAIETPTDINAGFREILTKFGPKLFGVAFGCESAAELSEKISSRVGKVLEVTSFDRDVTLPNGDKVHARFEVCVYPCLPPIGMYFFGCQHQTPEFIWMPELLDHENAVTGIQSVTIKVQNLDAVEESMRPCFDEQELVRGEFVMTLELIRPIHFVEAAEFDKNLGYHWAEKGSVDAIIDLHVANISTLIKGKVISPGVVQSDNFCSAELVCGSTLIRFMSDSISQ